MVLYIKCENDKIVLFQKAPLRSPLRDVLKKRCADRMKNNRDKVGIYFNV